MTFDEMPSRHLSMPDIGDKILGIVINVLDVTCESPFEIIPGHVFRRAMPPEIERINEHLRTFTGYSPELVMKREKRDGKMAETLSDDPSKWRYWVIEVQNTALFGGLNLGLWQIELASVLTPVELRCSLVLTQEGSSGPGSFHGSDDYYVFKRAFMWGPTTFDVATARLISETHKLLWQIRTSERESHVHVRQAINTLWQHSHTPHEHTLYPLGIFAIIESMLTHPPEPKDPTDSLTRQIKSKMDLLNRRFPQPLDISCFGGASFENVWKKLYAYRSALAHGDKPDFGGDLKAIRDRNTAVGFLTMAAKSLLRRALDEPDLIYDLKKC